MTPLHLELLVFFNGSSRHPRQDAPAVKTAIADFVEDGILEKMEPRPDRAPVPAGAYDLTLKGRAWLQMLLRTPYPRPVFVDSKGEVIEITIEPAATWLKHPCQHIPPAPSYRDDSPCG